MVRYRDIYVGLIVAYSRTLIPAEWSVIKFAAGIGVTLAPIITIGSILAAILLRKSLPRRMAIWVVVFGLWPGLSVERPLF